MWALFILWDVREEEKSVINLECPINTNEIFKDQPWD